MAEKHDLKGEEADSLKDATDVLIKAITQLDGTLVKHTQCLLSLANDATEQKRPDIETDDDTQMYTDRCEKKTVKVRVIFLKIGEIDTVKENFAADVFIQAKWQETTLDGHSDASAISWSHYWDPKLYVENLLGDGKEETWFTLLLDANGKATVVQKIRMKGVFLENMELGQFPFDSQDLTVTIASERSESEVVLIEDESEISSINVQSFVDEQEWLLHHHVETWKKERSQAYRSAKWRHPTLSVSCKARRRAGFFIWNILIVMFFICSLSFATFSVDIHLPQNRLQLSFTLVLTTIAFKFVTNQSLPKISYLTYLDKYILISMAILCSICVWHSILPSLIAVYGFDFCGFIDGIVLASIGGVYILFHVIFIAKICLVSVQKRVRYKKKDEAHTAKVNAVQPRSLFKRISPK